MEDGLLVVDARSRVTLMNPTFQKLFELRDPAVGVPLVEAVRHATLDQLIVGNAAHWRSNAKRVERGRFANPQRAARRSQRRSNQER